MHDEAPLGPARSCSLQGRRVLVVEDDFLLAEDLRLALEEAGAEALGPAPSVAKALALLAAGTLPDLAILDVNLRGEKVFPVAEALQARGVPFVFATGYDRRALPPAYAGAPCYEKPLDVERMLQALCRQGVGAR